MHIWTLELFYQLAENSDSSPVQKTACVRVGMCACMGLCTCTGFTLCGGPQYRTVEVEIHESAAFIRVDQHCELPAHLTCEQEMVCYYSVQDDGHQRCALINKNFYMSLRKKNWSKNRTDNYTQSKKKLIWTDHNRERKQILSPTWFTIRIMRKSSE